MKTNTKIILAFIGGAAIGSLICFELLKDKYESEAQEEVDNMADYYENLAKKEINDMSDYYEKEYDEMRIDIEELEDKKYRDYTVPYNMDEADDISEDYFDEDDDADDIDEDEDEEDDYDDVEAEYVNSLIDADPFIISREEFDNHYLFFDKETLTYYEGDNTLTDSQDEIIQDVESVVGAESLLSFGYLSDDEYIIYVRNGRLGTDYEVILAHESYAESVLGIK